MPNTIAIGALRPVFQRLAPAVDHCSLRIVESESDWVSVRRDVAEPPRRSIDCGAMITIIDGDGLGYAATSDLSASGIGRAVGEAHDWARLARGRSVFEGRTPSMPRALGSYSSPVPAVANSRGIADRIELLMNESRACKRDPRIVDWAARIWTLHSRTVLITADGGEAIQNFEVTVPSLYVTAYQRGDTQTRSWGGRYNGYCRQGGMEVVASSGFVGCAAPTAESALELLGAPNCPSGTMDLVLLPDQMMLQIHESIGHPLELDRILGDERNYAGRSFVTLDMFGSYRYGSPLLNVTFDPTRGEELASFAFDDEGSAAERTFLIRDGVLQRPLGGATSAQRAGMPAVATARATSWNRPPIDRMSNLNVEPGDASLTQMIESVEDGIMMQTNVSWSIDDSRNKFQFGCEWGRRIRGGKLAEVVRNPNYRGVSATFWRSLAMVGDAGTFEVMGTPFCGKGEPNQVIRVGHASPACKFEKVEVFGAEQ